MSDEIIEVVGSVDDLEDGQYVDILLSICFSVYVDILIAVGVTFGL